MEAAHLAGLVNPCVFLATPTLRTKSLPCATRGWRSTSWGAWMVHGSAAGLPWTLLWPLGTRQGRCWPAGYWALPPHSPNPCDPCHARTMLGFVRVSVLCALWCLGVGVAAGAPPMLSYPVVTLEPCWH